MKDVSHADTHKKRGSFGAPLENHSDKVKV